MSALPLTPFTRCVKVTYRTKKKAIHAIERIALDPLIEFRPKRPRRAYRCPRCLKWHLTSSTEKRRRPQR